MMFKPQTSCVLWPMSRSYILTAIFHSYPKDNCGVDKSMRRCMQWVFGWLWWRQWWVQGEKEKGQCNNIGSQRCSFGKEGDRQAGVKRAGGGRWRLLMVGREVVLVGSRGWEVRLGKERGRRREMIWWGRVYETSHENNCWNHNWWGGSLSLVVLFYSVLLLGKKIYGSF